MDDFVFWGDDKASLLRIRDGVRAFVRDTLSLELKGEPFLNRTSHGMDFLGMRVYPHAIRLSKTSRSRYVRKTRALEWMRRTERIDEAECQSRETSAGRKTARKTRVGRP